MRQITFYINMYGSAFQILNITYYYHIIIILFKKMSEYNIKIN